MKLTWLLILGLVLSQVQVWPALGADFCQDTGSSASAPLSPQGEKVISDLEKLLARSEPAEFQCGMPIPAAQSLVVFSSKGEASKAYASFIGASETGKQCARFRSNAQGKCGDYAQSIFDELYGYYFKSIAKGDIVYAKKRIPFFSDEIPDVIQVCPNFKSFTIQQRIQFWTWLIGAMSYTESSCGSNRQAMRGSPHGLLQLPINAMGRGGPCLNLITARDHTHRAHLSCGLHLLKEQLQQKVSGSTEQEIQRGNSRFSMDGRIFPRAKNASYWDALLFCGPKGRKMSKANPDCIRGTPPEPVNAPAARTWGIATQFPGCR